MPDYGHPLWFAANITPSAADAAAVISLAQVAEGAGLDLVTFQDHPYQPTFLDAWTLLSYAAATTSGIRLAGNVHPIPLRPPAVLAQAAASLDILSGGRLELALGAGGFPEAIASMGGPRRSPGVAVEALEEAIQIIRASWDTRTSDRIRIEGPHHQIHGLARGPSPAHDIGIWLGAYKPRMLRLVGRAADGWLPSLPRLRDPDLLADGNAHIDEAATQAGRSPYDIRRMLNLGGPSPAEQLAEFTLTHGTSVFVMATRGSYDIHWFAKDIAPAVRELVATERARATKTGADTDQHPTCEY